MRSIQRRFNAYAAKNVRLSSYINFAKAITAQHFGREQIKRWFNKLVEKDDYDKKERRQLIRHLSQLSNSLEEHAIRGKTASPSDD